MPNDLLDNTKAIEEMVEAMRQQTPVGGTPYANAMQRSLDELTSRMDKLAELYRMGAKPGSLAAQAARASVVEQQNYAAERFASLTKPEQKAFMPQLEVLQKEQVEKEELERRKKLNEELLRGQIAINAFVRAASEGHVGGMIGAAAGMIGGIAGTVGGVVAVIADLIQRKEQEYRSEVRQGGVEVMPAMEQTRQRSAELARMREALRTGEPQRLEAQGRGEQLRAQARSMPGWNILQDPEHGFFQFGPAAEAAKRAEQAFLREMREGSGQRPRAEAARQREINRFLEDWIREHGGTPQEFKQDVFMPNRTRFTTGEEYYQALGNAALEASGQQASNEVIRLQMEANGLLAQINNRLDRANPPIFGP